MPPTLALPPGIVKQAVDVPASNARREGRAMRSIFG
jgi:hypothetical protein